MAHGTELVVERGSSSLPLPASTATTIRISLAGMPLLLTSSPQKSVALCTPPSSSTMVASLPPSWHTTALAVVRPTLPESLVVHEDAIAMMPLLAYVYLVLCLDTQKPKVAVGRASKVVEHITGVKAWRIKDARSTGKANAFSNHNVPLTKLLARGSEITRVGKESDEKAIQRLIQEGRADESLRHQWFRMGLTDVDDYPTPQGLRMAREEQERRHEQAVAQAAEEAYEAGMVAAAAAYSHTEGPLMQHMSAMGVSILEYQQKDAAEREARVLVAVDESRDETLQAVEDLQEAMGQAVAASEEAIVSAVEDSQEAMANAVKDSQEAMESAVADSKEAMTKAVAEAQAAISVQVDESTDVAKIAAAMLKQSGEHIEGLLNATALLEQDLTEQRTAIIGLKAEPAAGARHYSRTQAGQRSEAVRGSHTAKPVWLP